MKVLTLVRAGQWGRPSKKLIRELETLDKHPRTTLFTDTLNADTLDEEFIHSAPAWRKLFYRFLPMPISQLIEAFIIKNKYDLIISWGEILGLPFALLLKLTHSKKPHIAIFAWVSKPKKATFLSKVHAQFDRIIIGSSYQAEFAINNLGIPSSKVIFMRWAIDQNFWRPLNLETNTICAAGREMRDYTTFLKAMDGLNIPCHIATPFVSDRDDSWKDTISSVGKLPSNLTIGEKSFVEMRELYARSRFVVVPVLESSDSDNGVTVILEAMAMGKAVICSKTKAQVDVIQDGVNGIFVEPANPEALRKSIKYLWEHPEEAERMGKEGRKYIEKWHTFDDFVLQVKKIAEDVLKEKGK